MGIAADINDDDLIVVVDHKGHKSVAVGFLEDKEPAACFVVRLDISEGIVAAQERGGIGIGFRVEGSRR